MKFKISTILFIFSFFLSCQEIKKEDILGTWIPSSDGIHEPEIYEIIFTNDKVELDDNLLKESGIYEIDKDIIRIKLKREGTEINTKIESLIKDTLLIFDGITYYRESQANNFEVDEFELIGISTNELLTYEKGVFYNIYIYQRDNKVNLRLSDKSTTYNDIPLFFTRGPSNAQVMLFIGQGVKLEELKELYYRLLMIGKYKVTLVTKKVGVSDYHIYRDKIGIWREDLETHMKKHKISPPLPPPPPIDFFSKENFLKKKGKEVKILNKEDIKKIENLDNDEIYVISISKKLSIENYLEIKKAVKKKKKTNIRIVTEIN